MNSLIDNLCTQGQEFLPLASVQQGIWLDQLAYPHLPYYNIGMTLEIKGDIDIALFEKAIQRVIDSHDALRLSFSHERGMGGQRVLSKAPFKLEVTDFPEVDGDTEQAIAHLRESFRQPFESMTGQLWESRLVRCGPQLHYWFNRLHHLVADGIGAVLIAHAVSDAYSGLLEGKETLAEGPSYLSFLEEDRAYMASSRYERDRLFWEQSYAQLPPVLLQRRADFKAGLTNVPAPSDQVQAMLPRALYNALTQFASECNLSVAHVLVGVISTYFCRTVGVDEIVVGMPVHNRTNARQKATIGMFSSVSPIRVGFDPHETLVDLMNNIGTQLRRTYRHQRFPIAELNRSLRLAQNGRHQLFDVSLSFESFDGDVTFGSEDPARVLMLDNGYEQTPMAIFVRDYHPSEDIHLDFNFNTAYFPFEEAQRVQQRIFAMLEAVLNQHDTPLAHFPLMSTSEHQQLATFNDTAHPYPRDVLIHQLIEKQAAQRPDACAVRGDSGPLLTYAELNQQANQLAHRLIELGVEPDTRVAVSLRRGAEMVVALLGILKAGGAYVPIDPDLPSARQAYMLEDSSPQAVLTTRDLSDNLSASDLPVLVLDGHDDRAQLASQPTGNPDAKALGLQPNHLAYVLYTSGSTGTPKGVMNEHLGVVNRLLWARDAYQVNSQDRVLQKTPFGFDVSVWEFFLPLLTGAELVMARPGGHQDPDYLAQVMSDAGITLLHFVPSMLDVFLEHRSTRDFPQLRRVLCSGEALPRALQRRFEQQLKGVELHNLYGPTEAAIDVTAWECRPTDPGDSVPIGRPIANIQMHVLDALGQLQPLGVAGELHIGGIGVARGYLNQPDLSAERFIADPFSEDRQARLYKTGDVGRWLANGALEYLGRNDFQVKIRGLRIEIGEIEAALAKHPAVHEAVVTAREDIPGDKRLVAYYTQSAEHTAVDLEILRSHLQQQLPEYMVPAIYVLLEAMPLTSNGKLDRKALPAPDGDALISRGYEAPQGEVETLLASIWADVLKVEQVGRHDHFFELGGHSLLAVKLIERMRQVGLSADVHVLFGQPTVAALAAAAGGGSEVVVPTNLIPEHCDRITPQMLPLINLSQAQIDHVVKDMPGGVANVQDIYPLAPLQAGILYHHISAEQGDPYTLKALFALSDRARLDDFSGALQGVINRHDILRTAVLWEDLDEPVQVVLRQAELHVTELFLDSADGPVDEQLHQRFDRRHYRLDVRTAPLMRIVFSHDPVNDRWLAMLLCHHLVSDATSLSVILQEIQAHLLGQGKALGEAVPYRNYVAQARLGVSEAQHEAFFRDMLGDIDEPTLPFGLQDVQDRGRNLEEASVTLAAELNLRLRAQARQAGVSVASLMHLAWARVLGNVSACEQVVFGTVLLGRMQAGDDADRALGMFINTLPLRVDIGATTVAEGLKATHEWLTALLGHEHAPLVLAQRCSGVAAPTPLFSALLNYRHSVVSDVSAEAASAWGGIESFGTEDHTNYPLTLNVDDLGDAFTLTIQAVQQINAQRIGEYMQVALRNLVDALEHTPQAALNSLSILPDDERELLLTGFNDTAHPYPRDVLIHQLIEQQAAQRPDACAVRGDSGPLLTYAELNQQANQLAHRLIELGVEPDTRVAVSLRRGAEMVVALLGILKAGGAYVPIDPDLPSARQTYMLEDSSPQAVLTTRDLSDNLPASDHPVLVLDGHDDRAQLARQPTGNPDAKALGLQPNHLAYVLYTSGSTGTPKGVMNEHLGVVNRLLWARDAYQVNSQDRVLQKTPFGFDVSVWEFFLPLLTGAELVMARPGGHQDPDYLAQVMSDAGITLLHFVPSMLDVFLEHRSTRDFPQLRRVLCSGEALPRALQRRFERHLKGVELHNLYGPTEAAIDVTAWECRPTDPGDSVPIGRPIANIQMHVLDALGQLQPLGVAGELHIGGIGVARGYLNQPDLSAERFIADPFSEDPQARLYKTGDVGRWLTNGALEYLGRNDFQVKIRGLRIEIGEIEAALAKHPAVHEAVVTAREDIPGDKRLVAYYTQSAEHTAVDLEALRSHLQQVLPEYMVPAIYVLLEAMPLTSNGKLDRKALPAPDGDALISRGYEAPQGEIEEQIAVIWQDLLGVEQVGRHDNFFELGGHSLLAVSLIDRLRKQDLNLNVNTVFTAPRVREMALAISQEKQALFRAPANRIPAHCTQLTPDMLPLVELSVDQIELIASAVPGGAANIQDIYPLAPLQEGILFHYLLNLERDAYLVRSTIEFDSRARLDAFLEGLQTVIDRHDVLRSSVHWVGLPQAVQVVHRQAQLPIHTLTLRPDEDALSQLDRLSDPGRLRLDLRQAPLLLAYIARDPDSERWLLALIDHHMISDHVTLELILEEIRLLMRGQSAELLPPQPYREFVAQTLASPSSAHEAYFTGRLADVDSPTAPFELLEVQGDGNDVEESELALSSDLCARIRTQARERGMSPAVLFHVAWAQVLARCTGRDDVVFGTAVTGRLQGTLGAERAMGMFMNTLPVRVQLATQSVQELVMATHRDLSELLSHEQASLALAQRCSSVATGVPLFSSLLNYRHQNEDSQLQWPGLRLLDSAERTNYPLCLSVNDYGSDLGLLIHSVQPADPQRLCAMMQCALEQLTDALAHTPQKEVTQLDVLPAAERNLLLETFNQTRQDYPTDLCIQHLFEAQVRTQPDAIAVAFQAQRLSYAELNRQANRLAHHLIGLGIGPDDRVAICVERGVEMMVGLLGVLKAGAAYVPLDPAYPAERLAYMIEDSQPAALMTQRHLQEYLPTLTLPLVLLDDDQRKTFTERDDNPVVEALGVRNLAYVIYTSGSTGNPKGVMIEHRGLVNYSVDAARLFDLSPTDTVLQQNTLNFDLSVEEIFPALLAGATLTPSREIFGSEGTENHGINPTVLHLTAAHWHTLVAEWHKQPQVAEQRLQHVRLINVTGDALSAQKLKLWDEVRPAHTRLINTYGPTEATVSCTAAYVSHDAAAGSEGSGNATIGKPMANTRIYLLDAHQQP
ncbi:syringomycin E biosynthesis non-ribosomal peptide synthetase SyrE, partial [Pseudomonas syringae]|nr:syringomycin E biosynthesis non-ribosomal peptide synthetase SyrE [Pseudomonas syringae]